MATNLSAAETYTEDISVNLIDIVVSDVDSANVIVTLTLSNPSYGSFNIGTSGAVTSTYNAGTGVWTASGAIANVNTLLAGLIFTPSANTNSNFSIATSVSDGVDSITGSKIVIGIAVNDAPILDSTKTPNLTSISQDAGTPSGSVGTLVSSLVDFASPAGQVDNVTDVDSASQLGIAIIATNTSDLACYYSLNNGSTWTPMGAVSNSFARLLAANGTNRVYCNAGSGVSGSYSNAITFRAWDQTSGIDGGLASVASNGGATAFSTATDTATLTINSSNHAPVLDNTKSPTLNSIAENSGTPSGTVGTSIATLVDLTTPAGGLDNVTDSDASPSSGIAVIAKDSGLICYYSINDGSSWVSLGEPSTSSARLLAANSSTRIYCRAVINVDGVVTAAITFKAWDQTSGTNGGTANIITSGGTTAFSSASDTAALTVTDSGTTQHIPVAVDDEYVMAEDATATALFVLNNDTDVDNDSLALISVTAPLHGTASIYDTAVVYTPAANYCGADSFDYVMTDGISEDTGTVSITLSCVNDAPVAVADTGTANRDMGGIALDVLGNDTDVENGSLTIVSVSSTNHGGVAQVILSGQEIGYTPPIDYLGDDMFTYTISDGNGGTDTGTVTIHVTNSPDTFIITKTSASISSSSATFEFESNESPVTFECAIDTGGGAVFTACTSPWTSSLFVPGNHYTFLVRAKDADDNTDQTPAEVSWTVSNMLVASIVPENGAVRVGTRSPIVVTFTNSVPEGLRDGLVIGASPCDGVCPRINGTWSDGNKVLTLTNDGSYDKGKTYTITLSVNNGITEGLITTTSFTTVSPSSVVGGTVSGFKAPSPQIVASNIVVPKYHFPRTLKFGMTGDDVVMLQKFLGITPPASKHFGPLTKASLIKYQKEHGLDADGIAGPKTLAVIEREMNK